MYQRKTLILNKEINHDSHTIGGWAANFILEWKSDDKITEPVIEAIHSGARGTHSYIFDTQGKVIKGVYE